jgi:hypothetical protein
MAGFYTARSRTIPPLPWPSFAPPFSAKEDRKKQAECVQHGYFGKKEGLHVISFLLL